MSFNDPDDPVEEGRYAELVARLRAMQWPRASTEARKHCYETVRRKLATTAESDGSAPAEGEPPAEGPALVWEGPSETPFGVRPRRHEFVTRAGGYSAAVGARVAVARGPMRAPVRVR